MWAVLDRLLPKGDLEGNSLKLQRVIYPKKYKTEARTEVVRMTWQATLHHYLRTMLLISETALFFHFV